MTSVRERFDSQVLGTALKPSPFIYRDDRSVTSLDSCTTAWVTDMAGLPAFCRTAKGSARCEPCAVIYRHAKWGGQEHGCSHRHKFPHTPTLPATTPPNMVLCLPWAWCWVNQLEIALHHGDAEFVSGVLRQPHVDALHIGARPHIQRMVAAVMLQPIGDYTYPARWYVPHPAVLERLECVRRVMDFARLWEDTTWMSDLLCAVNRQHRHVHFDSYQRFLVAEYGAVRWDMHSHTWDSPMSESVCDFVLATELPSRLRTMYPVMPQPLNEIICQYVSVPVFVTAREQLLTEKWAWRASLRFGSMHGFEGENCAVRHRGEIVEPPKSRAVTHMAKPGEHEEIRWLLQRWRYCPKDRVMLATAVATSMIPDAEEFALQCLESEGSSTPEWNAEAGDPESSGGEEEGDHKEPSDNEEEDEEEEVAAAATAAKRPATDETETEASAPKRARIAAATTD